MRFHSRLILIVILATAMWDASPLRAQQDADGRAAGARLVATRRVSVGGTLFESKAFALQPGEGDAVDLELPRPSMQVSFSIVNFDEAVFGRSTPGTTFDPVQERQRLQDRQRLAALLARKVSDVERHCELTVAQKQKLELAGRGDLYRLFERIEALRLGCQAVCEADTEQNAMTLLLRWARGVCQEMQPLKGLMASGPFGEGSLFAKTLAGMISPGQLAEYRRQQSSAGSQPEQPLSGGVRPPLALAIAKPNASLAEVLAGWEKAASQIDRLDCEFMRFKYDRTFEVEWRGKGSLVVEKSGSAIYRIEPEPMKPGEVSKKLGAGGAPYTLKSDQSERWHWTGKSVIHLNDKERTYDELVLPDSQFPLAHPFLLGMPTAELQDRFQIELKRESDNEVWLAFTPKHKKEQANLTNVILILSKDRYQPKALKIIDPTGCESVHVFKNVQINRRGPVDDLDRANLHGYRRVLDETAR